MTIAIRRPITVLAACAAVGALVTGCGAGPGGTAAQISSAALVGGHPVSLQTVQQNITDVLADSADARKLQQQKPSAFPPVARTIAQYAVWDEVTNQLAAKMGVTVGQDKVDQLYNQVTASGQFPTLGQPSNIPVKGDLLKTFAKDNLLWGQLGTKQLGSTVYTLSYGAAPDRNGAQQLVDKIVAHPEQHGAILDAAMVANGGSTPSDKGKTIDQTFPAAAVPQALQPLWGADAGTVVAFPVQDQSGSGAPSVWAVVYVQKIQDNVRSSAGGQDLSQLAGQFGFDMMVRYAQQVGVDLNPRFGVWEPLIGGVSASEGETATLTAKVTSAP
ncbi:hypothetical protein BCF44_111134 [Kutzneria buriramensis]|uniref:SurA-like protein n=1 Tax=Kutzneria buriramensis TaxID=1045776 RepID=A0A3E0HBR5_9PSEU|nr:hypothetical protein BCF44_111134 [Kutzneria buriramensis]